jgi:hypothetical protein
MMCFTRSTGQGFSFSKTVRAISTKNCASIAQKLMTRSLTAGGLHVRVHQHYYKNRVLLEWRYSRDLLCLERVINASLARFCRELVNGGAEGLCSCMCAFGWHPNRLLGDKATPCFPKRKLVYSKHDRPRRPPRFTRIGPVSSSATLVEWK